jgi:hypothetical protein
MKPAHPDRGKAHLPPRWFIEAFWHVHRRVVKASSVILGYEGVSR